MFLIISDESGSKTMLIVRISNAGSGGVGETAFTIKDGQLILLAVLLMMVAWEMLLTSLANME